MGAIIKLLSEAPWEYFVSLGIFWIIGIFLIISSFRHKQSDDFKFGIAMLIVGPFPFNMIIVGVCLILALAGFITAVGSHSLEFTFEQINKKFKNE